MTEILDDSAVSEIEAVNWKKGFPDLDGDYYCRVDEYDRQPTLIRIESRSSMVPASVYEFGCGDDLRREYEAEEEYEYLGPLDPVSIPALCATVKQLRADIEKARELVTAWHVQCDEMEPEVNRTWDDDGALRIRTIRKLADELSLTLDQVKPGEM